MLACNTNKEEYSHSKHRQVLDDFYDVRYTENADTLNRQLDSFYTSNSVYLPKDLVGYYDLKSWYYRVTKQPDSALMYIDSILMVLTPIEGAEAEYVKALNTKGILLKEQKLYNESIKVLYAASNYAQEHVEVCASSHVLANLGHVLIEQANYTEAIRYYKKAILASRQCSPDAYVDYLAQTQSFYNAIGLSFERSEEYDSAVVYYEKALNFLGENEARFAQHSRFIMAMKGVVIGNYGNTLFKKGLLEEAKSLLKKSIEINSGIGNEQGDAMLTLVKLGHLYLKEGYKDSARIILQEVESRLDDLPHSQTEIRLKRLARYYFKAIGDTAKAFQNQVDYERLQAMASKEGKALAELNLNNTFKLLEQKDELAELKEQQRHYRLYIALAIVAVLILLSSAFIYRRSLIKSRQHAYDLGKLNAEITDQHNRLKSAMDALEKSHEENNRIMKVLAHDLRSPIGGMLSLSNLMLEGEVDKAECSQMINQLAKDSLGFIDSLLNFRMANDEANMEELNLRGLVDYCASMLRFRADEKEQRILVQGEQVIATVYREQIWRVINNVVGNAIKFSPKGASIQVFVESLEEGACIRVVDQGIGIPKDLQRKVFDLVTDAKRMGTEGEKAFGMGLAISRQIMEAHGGTIQVESQDGKGSTFTLCFPN